jgi:hypothetical protein
MYYSYTYITCDGIEKEKTENRLNREREVKLPDVDI